MEIMCKSRIAKALLIATIVMLSTSVQGARQRYHLPFYDHCSKLPTDTLMALADRYSLHDQQIDSALVCYSVVANRYYERNLSHEEIEKSVWAMNRLGYLFKYSHFDYEKSYGYLTTALDICEKHGLKRYLPYINQNLAPFYNMDSEESAAKRRHNMMDCYKLAFEQALELNDYKVLTAIFINLVNFSGGTDSLASIHSQFASFMRIPADSAVEMHDFALALYEGSQCMEHHDYERALKWFGEMETHIDTPVEVMAARYRMMAVSKKMQAHFAMGDRLMAVAQLDTLLALSQRYKARDVTVDAYKVYYQYSLDQGKTDQANQYYRLYLENKDSLLTHDKLQGITEINFQVQLNRASEQVRTLSYKRRMEGYILVGVMAFALVLAVMLALLVYSNRQLKTKNRHLYEKSAAAVAEMERRRQLQMDRDKDADPPQDKAKYSSSKLDSQTIDVLEQRIARILENSDEIYADDFSIKRLADLTGSNQTYVSQVINMKYGKTFSVLLSEYRINEACRRLGSPRQYGDYTIEAIAQSVGFKSRTSFVALFKKSTGLTPSAYQKMARQG